MDDVQTTGSPPPVDPTAIFGRRTVAFLIDLAIGVALFVAVFAAVAESADLGSSFSADAACEILDAEDDANICFSSGSTVILAEGSDVAVIVISMLIYGIGAMVILPTITGGSLGKLIVGLRVVDQETFAKADFGKHLLRWILLAVDWFPWFLGIPLVGLITGLSTRGHRRVGDLVANTLVVDKVHVDQPVSIEGVNGPGALPAPVGPHPPPTAPPVATTPPPPSLVPPSPPPMTPPVTTTAPPPNVVPSPPPEIAAPPMPAPSTPATDAVAAPEPARPEPESEPESETEPEPETASEPPEPPAPPASPAPPDPEPVARPGVDAPQWDDARNTYIQWDPELTAWMEWDESASRWIAISQ